jgi:hypothetical protein
MNYGCVSYREEASEFWMCIIQGRGQRILDAYHTGKRPMNSGYVSYREEVNELWIPIIPRKGQ